MCLLCMLPYVHYVHNVALCLGSEAPHITLSGVGLHTACFPSPQIAANQLMRTTFNGFESPMQHTICMLAYMALSLLVKLST
jgi:hypothetical protein